MPAEFFYIGWNRSLPEEVADHLRQTVFEPGSYDDYLLWLPSARTGRHVLQELFTGAEEEVEAFHPPRLTTPARFRKQLLTRQETAAAETTCLQGWREVLAAAPVEPVERIFISGSGPRTAAWAYGFGENLLRLRQRLAEDGHNFASVARSCPENDRSRWQALAELEGLWLQWLHARGLIDPEEQALEDVAGYLREEPVREIWVAGVLNLTQRQEGILRAFEAEGLSVKLLVPAPEEEAAAFDDRGRPRPEAWNSRPLPEELLKGRLHRGGDARVLAPSLFQLCRDYGESVDRLLVGATEPGLAQYLIEQGPLSGISFYNPEGQAMRETHWGAFVGTVREFLDTDSLDALFDLLLFPPLRKWMRDNGLSPERAEIAFRRLQRERLLSSLSALWDKELRVDKNLQEARQTLAVLNDLFGELRKGVGGLFERLWTVIRRLAENEQGPDNETIREQVRILHDLLEELRETAAVGEASESDQWHLLLHSMESRRFYRERRGGERPVSGWLEFAFERAPHLVLFGLPDAEIPGSSRTDIFLVPQLTRHLGLYGQEDETAFHAFRLRYVLETRRERGKVEILLPDRALDGTPQVPSRFLFLAESEALPARVKTLLTKEAPQQAAVPSRFGDRLRLPEPVEMPGLSVTAFKAWLIDPFQFYLERVMGWEVPRNHEEELDAMQFGSLLHVVMSHYNTSVAARELTGNGETESFLLDTLQTECRARFGTSTPLAVRIQREAMEQRLRAVAPLLAQERRQGWKPVEAEWKIHDRESGRSWIVIDGISVSGVIDLIERNEESKELRVVDYKTSDKPQSPFDAHLGKVTAASSPPVLAETEVNIGGKPLRWKDLQLPLYAAAVEQAFGERPRICYISLPKTVLGTGLGEWSESPPPVEEAVQCATAIVREIRAGVYWPPSRNFTSSDWQPWMGPVPEENLDEHWLQRHGRAEA